MVDCNHYKNESLNCPLNCEKVDTQEHILECDKIDANSISNNHSDLFSDNVEKQLNAAAILSERLKKRKIIIKKKED